VDGSSTGIVARAVTHSPPMKRPVGTDSMTSRSRVSVIVGALWVSVIAWLLRPRPCRCPHPRSIVNNQTTNWRLSMTALSPLLKQATPVTVDHALGCEVFDSDGGRHL